MKKCSQCGIEKPLEDFNKRKNSKDGHRADCRMCKTAVNAKWLACNKDRKAASDKAHYEANREAIRARQAEYYQETREVRIVKIREWWQKNGHTQKLPARGRRLANLEKRRADRRQHYADNKAMYVANARAREEHIAQATPPWADLKLIQKAYEAADLLNQVTGEWHHVDHIVPLRHKLVCGLHVPYNLQILSAEENLRKGNTFRQE